MIIAIAGIVVFGMYNSIKKQRQEVYLQYVYDENEFSVIDSINEIFDNADNLLKIAIKYKAGNEPLEKLYEDVKVKTGDTRDWDEQVDPDKLKDLLDKVDELEPVLMKAVKDTEDEKYLTNIMVEIRSLKSQIVHSSYNDAALEWNTKLWSFPISILKNFKVGGKPVFPISILKDYRNL